MEKPGVEKLIGLVTNYDQQRSELERSLAEGRADELWVNMVEWKANIAYGLNAFFINHDVQLAKAHFYTCGIIDELLVNQYGKEFNFGVDHLGYALLSDSIELIRRYGEITSPGYIENVEKGDSAVMYLLQCIVRDDERSFERYFPIMKDKTAKKLDAAIDADILMALMEKRTGECERLLTELVSPSFHKKRNDHQAITKYFISHPAITYAKLAWLKGMQVNVNSPYLPKELLVFSPLSRYERIRYVYKG